MKQKSVPEKEPATQVVKNIRRATRRHFSAEDKDPHCTGRPARRGQYRRALPPRGDRPDANVILRHHAEGTLLPRTVGRQGSL
jgi:hypothetical protein